METKHEWVEITVTVDAMYADAVANFLLEQGSTGIAQEDLREQRASGIACLKAYMPNDDTVAGAVSRIETYIASLAAIDEKVRQTTQISVAGIPDEDWNKKWKSFFHPLHVSKRLVIKPSWQPYWKQAGEIVIELDPGMAFGTGTHPSTRLCLQALDDIAAQVDGCTRASLLDVGTGSGILAIAGVLLGFAPVVGIDVDATAIACARTNAERNGIGDTLSLSTTPIRDVAGVFSVVVANILPHTLIHMKDHLVARLAPNGTLILSGILAEKADEVIAAFSPQVSYVRTMREENWVGLVFAGQADTAFGSPAHGL